MAYVITDACTACGTCVETCPVEAISEGDPIYKIDAEACIDCGLCIDECPVQAIFPEEDLPEQWQEFVAKNAAYYQ